MSISGVTFESGVGVSGGLSTQGFYTGVVFVGVQNHTTTSLNAYSYNSETGFGTKYSDPSGATIDSMGVGVTSDGAYVMAAGGYISSAYNTRYGCYAYPWNSSTGFGVKVAGTDTTTSGGTNTNFTSTRDGVISPDGSAMAIALYTGKVPGPGSMQLRSRLWNGSSWTTTGAISANTSNGTGALAISPNNDAILALDTTGLYWWPLTNGVIGVQSAAALASPASGFEASTFNNAGTVVVGVTQSGPYVRARRWVDAVTGWGTSYTSVGTGGTSVQPTDVVFTPKDDAVIVACTNTIYAYPWDYSTGFGTQYSNPGVMPTASTQCVAVTPLGDSVIFGGSTPTLDCYKWNSATGFGTKLSSPVTAPTASVLSLAVLP